MLGKRTYLRKEAGSPKRCWISPCLRPRRLGPRSETRTCQGGRRGSLPPGDPGLPAPLTTPWSRRTALRRQRSPRSVRRKLSPAPKLLPGWSAERKLPPQPLPPPPPGAWAQWLGGACALGRERCPTAPARGQPRARPLPSPARRCSPGRLTRSTFRVASRRGSACSSEVLYKRIIPQSWGRFASCLPSLLLMGIGCLKWVWSSLWAELRKPGCSRIKAWAMINLAIQTRAGSSSESGCPLSYTYLGKLLDIQTREPSPQKRIVRLAAFLPASECIVFTHPNQPPFHVLLRGKSSLRMQLL